MVGIGRNDSLKQSARLTPTVTNKQVRDFKNSQQRIRLKCIASLRALGY
jgi:hypothetical protein